jgi:hypothetical protein
MCDRRGATGRRVDALGTYDRNDQSSRSCGLVERDPDLRGATGGATRPPHPRHSCDPRRFAPARSPATNCTGTFGATPARTVRLAKSEPSSGTRGWYPRVLEKWLIVGLERRWLLSRPRSLAEELPVKLNLRDERVEGDAVAFEFCSELNDSQHSAASALLKHDVGVLCAPPGWGKTVLASQLIASRAC